MRALTVALLAGAVLLGVPAVSGAAGTFVDDDESVHEGNIEAIAAVGVTRGCNPPKNDRFCPVEVVTRAQMASFLARAIRLAEDVPVPGGDFFTDDSGSVHEGDINTIAVRGVTRGCNPPTGDRYCPDDPVTRGQMAAFLARAFELVDDEPGDRFVDDDASIFESDIEAIAAAGITLGCNPPTNDRYCPEDAVTRGQMASFLARALGLMELPPA